MTPKELITDEMIEKAREEFSYSGFALGVDDAWGKGAKWARDFLSTHTREVAEKAADKEYAKGFAEFIGKNNWQKYILDDYTWWRAGMKERASTDELLSLYDDHLAKLEKEKIK